MLFSSFTIDTSNAFLGHQPNLHKQIWSQSPTADDHQMFVLEWEWRKIRRRPINQVLNLKDLLNANLLTSYQQIHWDVLPLWTLVHVDRPKNHHRKRDNDCNAKKYCASNWNRTICVIVSWTLKLNKNAIILRVPSSRIKMFRAKSTIPLEVLWAKRTRPKSES